MPLCAPLSLHRGRARARVHARTPLCRARALRTNRSPRARRLCGSSPPSVRSVASVGQGASFVYLSFIEPFLKAKEEKIDFAIANSGRLAKEHSSKVISSITDKAGSLSSEARRARAVLRGAIDRAERCTG